MSDPTTTEYNDETQENHENVNGVDDAAPSEYDRTQDTRFAEESAAKDAEIADLKARLQVAEQESTSVVDVPSNVPVSTEDDVAKFHEVPAPGTDAPSAGAPVDLPTNTADSVALDPAPVLTDSYHPDTSGETVQNQDDLKAAVAEILTLTREIHETVEWVKEQAPQVGSALANSPFGKMLPSFFTTGTN